MRERGNDNGERCRSHRLQSLSPSLLRTQIIRYLAPHTPTPLLDSPCLHLVIISPRLAAPDPSVVYSAPTVHSGGCCRHAAIIFLPPTGNLCISNPSVAQSRPTLQFGSAQLVITDHSSSETNHFSLLRKKTAKEDSVSMQICCQKCDFATAVAFVGGGGEASCFGSGGSSPLSLNCRPCTLLMVHPVVK